ncbi:MAG: hypothetical protein Q7S40_29875 [Opitutaceae bacterium]|nr:hypothetical protein [Opitutaceae bacterium]
MSSRLVRSGSVAVLSCTFALAVVMAADSRNATIRPAGSASKADPKRTAKGTLPDPVLLDGSPHPAEKRSETGMIGDFELPGDENAPRNGKVGQQGGGGQQQDQQEQQQQGGGGGPQTAQAQEQGGGGSQQAQQQQGGPQGTGKQGAGQGDPNAKAEGIQVAELQGEGGGPGNANTQKPGQVSIGDSAMQIKTVANAPSVVGAQQPSGQTQQHEKATGTGGRPPTGNNANRGSEKGRAMPAGL